VIKISKIIFGSDVIIGQSDDTVIFDACKEGLNIYPDRLRHIPKEDIYFFMCDKVDQEDKNIYRLIVVFRLNNSITRHCLGCCSSDVVNHFAKMITFLSTLWDKSLRSGLDVLIYKYTKIGGAARKLMIEAKPFLIEQKIVNPAWYDNVDLSIVDSNEENFENLFKFFDRTKQLVKYQDGAIKGMEDILKNILVPNFGDLKTETGFKKLKEFAEKIKSGDIEITLREKVINHDGVAQVGYEKKWHSDYFCSPTAKDMLDAINLLSKTGIELVKTRHVDKCPTDDAGYLCGLNIGTDRVTFVGSNSNDLVVLWKDKFRKYDGDLEFNIDMDLDSLDYIAVYEEENGTLRVYSILKNRLNNDFYELFRILPQNKHEIQEKMNAIPAEFLFFKDRVFLVDEHLKKIKPIKIRKKVYGEETTALIDCLKKASYMCNKRQELSCKIDNILDVLEDTEESFFLRDGLRLLVQARDSLVRAM
jgi:hypothetical protein